MNRSRLRQVLVKDPNEPRAAWLFTLLLASISLGLGVLSFRGQQHELDWAVIAFALLVAVAESMPVTLPRVEQSVSVAYAIGYATVVLFPPAWAALAVAVGILLANLYQGKRLNIWLFNVSQLYIAAYVGAMLWHVAGGSAGEVLLVRQLPVLAATAAVIYVTNITLTTVSVSLAYGLPWREVIYENIRWGIPNVLVLWTLGLLIVALFRSDAGLLGVLLLWLPLLVVRYSFHQYVQLKHAHLETVQSLAAALDAKDPSTHGHSQRVADLSARIARHFKLPVASVEAVHYAGILHDIGKIGVEDGVLKKAGNLTKEDWEKIRSHPVIGADIVKNVKFLEGIGAIIRHHHERFDGTGYPDGLKGEDIPLGARIVCVADAFDAMTTERAYRKAMTVDEAVAELRRQAGRQFDPEVVDKFVRYVVPELKAQREAEAGKAPPPSQEDGRA